MTIRGYVLDELTDKPRGGEYVVEAEIQKHLGIRYGITKRLDGGKGWSVWEWATGLLVCHAGTKKEALYKIEQLHRSVARVVQYAFDHGCDLGMYHDWANPLTDAEYDSLVQREYGKGDLSWSALE